MSIINQQPNILIIFKGSVRTPDVGRVAEVASVRLAAPGLPVRLYHTPGGCPLHREERHAVDRPRPYPRHQALRKRKYVTTGARADVFRADELGVIRWKRDLR